MERHSLFSQIQHYIREQNHGPIPFNGRNYYVIDKESFEKYFPRDVQLEYDEHDKFINQLLEQQPIYYYVINEELYSKYRPGNNANKSIEEFKKTCENCKTFQKEVTKYQSALGDATSFHLGNQDSDATSQLLKDIGNLHSKLEEFCGLKKGIEVNDKKAIELLKKYECSIKGTIKDSKILISGALERYVIETIIEKAKEYFGHKENDKDNKEVDEQGDKIQQSLEAKIENTTEQLLKMIKSFPTIRTGNDEVTKAAPTKLRQQIYGILGNRGFSNTVLDESDSKEHPFVEKLRKEILDLMNRYREIKDKDKLVENEKMINEIIRQVVNIFFFRLKVQEPIAEYKWFPKNEKINTLLMDGSWDKDELEDLSVDICAFPLIGSNLNSPGDEKMMFQAQIIADNSL